MLGLLAIVVGLTLGLFGGGGSILAVPLLLFATEMAPKAAIAGSLAIIAIASAVTMLAYAWRGQVRWRVGLVFGAAGMAGAFVGGRLAQFVPASILLAAFAVMMLVTALAMLRNDRGPSTPHATERPPWLFAVEGSIVGLVTGMVGAGGGFLVVPALVLLGRVPMREAIGTSLLVIALKSAAGFAGYATHTTIDLSLVATVAAFASMGAVIGGMLGQRIRPQRLRKGFGVFVLVMAIVIVGRQLLETWTLAELYDAMFVNRWPWWIGGAAIGTFALAFLWHDNHLLGISTGYTQLCKAACPTPVAKRWRPRFLLGIVLGGGLAGTLAGREVTFAFGQFDHLWSDHLLVKAAVLVAAGFLVGYGARQANGCTSGHAIVGVAQGAKASLVATVGFMVAGVVVTHLVTYLAGI